MKIGVRIENAWTTSQQLTYAKQAERLGFDSLWAEGNPFKREPFSVLGVLARETTHVQLGLAVASVYLMHPLLAASAAATLDELSGGRMRIAVGASSVIPLTMLGLPQSQPVGKVREAVQLVQALLRGGTADFQGEFFSLNGVKLEAASGRPIPVYAAAEAEKMQKMVGEVADGLIFTLGGEEYNRRTVQNIEEGLRRSGRRRDQFRMVAYGRFWTVDDPAQDMTLLRQLTARLVYRVSPATWRQMGLDEELARRYASDPAAIPESLIRELIFVGNPAQSAKAVRSLAQFGFDELVLDYPASRGWSFDEQYARYYALMSTFGERVLPQLEEVR